MEDELNFFENGRQPHFNLKIEDNLNFRIMEDDLHFFKLKDDLIFWKLEDDPKFNKNATLTNSTAQHRQPYQHNNQKYIGTIKTINLKWL